MSDDRRKMNKICTGTVPKTKSRNNRSQQPNGRDSPRSWTTNNLDTHLHRLNFINDYLRNSRRNSPNLTTMNTVVDEQSLSTRTINGSITPSSSTSRRNSSGAVPKCDNITKYPDKKQIEDKLSQIREYLQITTSLMQNMKITDEQSNDELENLVHMITDLKDSERKLVDILDSMDEVSAITNELIQKNEQILENGVDGCQSESESNSFKNDLDTTNREFEILKDQQLSLMSLQQKAENRLKDARQIQDKLLSQGSSSSNQRQDKNFAHVDAAIRELEERTKRLNEPRGGSSNLQDKLLADVDSLHNQIIGLHNVNEDRTQLIQVLDNRDQELKAQHAELQTKLSELQNKKNQVDQLVSQLQNLDEAEDDDVGTQVKRIVTMKDQLSKLKDMLEIVKTTESVIQNTNGVSAEEQELACAICTKAENFLQKDDDRKMQQLPQNDSNVVRYDNKQMNKNSTTAGSSGSNGAGGGGAKPRVTNKLALRAELEAKKRELEDIMGKHKAGTSNLNHDVGVDNKSEFSCSSNTFFDGGAAWPPLSCEHNRFDASDRYSSDECDGDVNEYSDHNQSFSLPLPNYSRRSKHNDHDYVHLQETDRLSSITRTPDRNLRSNSVTTGSCSRERPRSNSEQVNKTQVQKQLELIRSVCDSMLEQQQHHQHIQQQQQQQQQHQQQQQATIAAHQSSNVQLRNNLTPSPLYSEPRRFASPNPQPTNVLNVVNPLGDGAWIQNGGINHESSSNNYQGWLATNTLQTQAFMLNTLNQCCQMLWLQQRELATLRLTVNQLQDRVDNSTFENASHLASPLQVPNGGGGGGGESRSSSNQYRQSNQKTNQVSGACSMPNLNQYNVPVPNIDPNNYHNNARLLDTCLNNANIHNGDAINNMANINQAMQASQMWNGQALNNQVAPGNRANNYWDNFRSYSRQNLLSTKSNEGLQNLTTTSSTNAERTNPFALITTSKSNSSQTSLNTSQETTPQRRTQFSSSSTTGLPFRRTENRPIPPDVLNVNHNNRKTNDHQQNSGAVAVSSTTSSITTNPINNGGSESSTQRNNLENDSSYQMYINNAFGYNETSSNHSNISEEQIFKDCIPETTGRRNEWHEDQSEDQYPKSKLFEELRENVYKEVVTLISANEARPHFLIQLFRDLQMISSDPLRLKILQSIQTIITHSLISSTHLNQQILENPSAVNDQMLSDCFSLQSTVWSKSTKDTTAAATAPLKQEMTDNADVQNSLKEVIPYLNDHEDDIISHHFLTALKQVLIDSEAFRETVRDAVFKKHFCNVLDEVLNQFVGKKVCDVKMVILQTITDLLQGELSFIQLIQDTCPENCETVGEILPPTTSSPHVAIFEPNATISNLIQQQQEAQIQNGDLAEADQGRVEDDDTEEEGAVGGFWDQLDPQLVVVSSSSNTNQNNAEEVDVSTMQYQNSSEVQFSKQGLDQVPTRLPTKSRSNTPNKDRSSSRSDHQQEPF